MSGALYNRYRPATFAEVVGQEHVTGALMQALRTGRLHHAYLFSGPRGCGKTSSARILAASLNCVNGPTPEPCGQCEQCVTIRTGSSMDVTEIDAASHGLVDDARDLRERAFFAPASARFKVYVVDEAHMVTAAAFNALLKVVEEPPPYLKFVFATTEPGKVIATVRSRTHHYAFRLVPPGVLRDHLASICAAEGVEVEPSVLPLVVRAGAGSVRDSLSVLDQLLAGTGTGGLTYERAIALLGMTDGVLLDEAVDALAAQDGATAFTVVDKVVSSGHDPRRFAMDLLERLRDLIVLGAVPDAPGKGLLETYSADQLDRMRGQCSRMGPAELSRAADMVHAGLVEMRGTTSPRLLLELILARVLLPGAGSDPAALLVRIERLERRADAVGPAASATTTATATATTGTVTPAAAGAPSAPPGRAARTERTDPSPRALASAQETTRVPAAPPASNDVTAPAPAPWTERPGPVTPSSAPVTPPTPTPPVPVSSAPGDAVDAGGLRAMWDDVLRAARSRKPATHALLQEYASVADVRGDEVILAFSVPTIARMFGQGSNIEVLCAALAEVVGGSWRVTIGPAGGSPGGSGTAAGARAAARSGGFSAVNAPTGTGFAAGAAAPGSGGFTRSAVAPSPATTTPPPSGAPQPVPDAGPRGSASLSSTGQSSAGQSGAGVAPSSPPAESVAHEMRTTGPAAPPRERPRPRTAALAGAARGNRNMDQTSPAAPATTPSSYPGVADDAPSPDDDDAPGHSDARLSGEEAAVALLRSGLGATIIEQRTD